MILTARVVTIPATGTTRTLEVRTTMRATIKSYHGFRDRTYWFSRQKMMIFAPRITIILTARMATILATQLLREILAVETIKSNYGFRSGTYWFSWQKLTNLVTGTTMILAARGKYFRIGVNHYARGISHYDPHGGSYCDYDHGGYSHSRKSLQFSRWNLSKRATMTLETRITMILKFGATVKSYYRFRNGIYWFSRQKLIILTVGTTVIYNSQQLL